MSTLEKLSTFLASDVGIGLMRSLILIALLVILRFCVLRLIHRTHPDMKVEEKRRWSISLRNAVVFSSLLGLIFIWASELQSLALSIVAFAAALVLATKELIMCFSGSLLRTASQSYSLGDVIEVSTYQGRVVDINMFTTTLAELGPHGLSHRMTGKIIKMPNSLLLIHPVIRDNDLGDFILDTIVIPVPYAIDPIKAEQVVIEATKKYALPYYDEAERSINIQEIEKLLDTPSIRPRISMVPMDDKQYKFIVRIAIPKEQRNRIEQEIFRDFLCACYGQNETNTIN